MTFAKKFTPILFISFSTLSADLYSSGARYAGQAGAMVANANDTFALAVNNTNLLSHGMQDYAEFAANVQQYSAADDSDSRAETDYQFIGGFFSSNSYMFGGYFLKSLQPVLLQKGGETAGLAYYDQLSLSGAFGNKLASQDGTGVLWGLGISLDSVNAFDQDGRDITDPELEFTYSGKLGYVKVLNFNGWDLDATFNLAISHHTETLAISQLYDATTIRPAITRIGLLNEFRYVDAGMDWRLRLSLEKVQINATYTNKYNTGLARQNSDYRVGVEILVNRFAFRGGYLRSDNEQDKTFFSSGIGYLGEKWAYDLSLSEVAFDEKQIDLSATYTFSL